MIGRSGNPALNDKVFDRKDHYSGQEQMTIDHQ